jgi:hypothetical protein
VKDLIQGERHATIERSFAQMTNRAALKTALILLVLAAGALGWSQVARAHRGSVARADTALTAKAYGGLARRGFPVYFAFRVQGDGTVTVHTTVRLGSRLALSGTLKRNAPYWDRRDLWKPKPIRRSFPAGRYTYCVVATDAAGHRAKSCAPYRVV